MEFYFVKECCKIYSPDMENLFTGSSAKGLGLTNRTWDSKNADAAMGRAGIFRIEKIQIRTHFRIEKTPKR
jgi:hypothetical protein